MNAIIYLRVSTDEQAQSGLGLEAQRAACESRARALGAASISIFTDAGVSGATPVEDRVGLVAALDAVRRGDSLIIAKMDRLGREGQVFLDVDAMLRLRKATLVSAAGEGTDAAGSAAFLMRGMMRLLAEYEREVIRERTGSALKAKRTRGEKTGGLVPFGQRVAGIEIVDGKQRKLLISDAHEQAAIARMVELRFAGQSYREIAESLRAEGVCGRGCARLSHVTVRRCLTDRLDGHTMDTGRRQPQPQTVETSALALQP